MITRKDYCKLGQLVSYRINMLLVLRDSLWFAVCWGSEQQVGSHGWYDFLSYQVVQDAIEETSVWDYSI